VIENLTPTVTALLLVFRHAAAGSMGAACVTVSLLLTSLLLLVWSGQQLVSL
jgi:hypothetical protein